MKQRFSKFALIGTVGTALQLTLLMLLIRSTHLSVTAANTLAVELTLLHNFLWHERFTWPNRPTHSISMRLLRFHLGNGSTSLLGNAITTYYLVHCFHTAAILAALLSIALCSLANFLLADRWIFSPIQSQ